MKRIVVLTLVLALAISFAACAAPTQEAASNEDTMPTVSEAASTPEPTEQPTPTPTPESTLDPELIEAKRMFDIWQKSREKERWDVYANLVATKAYRDGCFDSLIDEGTYTEEDIEALVNYNGLFKGFYYPVSDNILTEDYDVEDLTAADLAIAILRGDDVKATAEQIIDAYYALTGVISHGFSLISAFPESSREDLNELINIIDNRVNVKKDVTDLEEIIDNYNLDWKEKWYINEYLYVGFGISPYVTCNGEEMQLAEYADSLPLSQTPFEVEETLQENYLQDPNEVLDIFGIKVK